NQKYWPILEFAEAHNVPIYLHPFFPQQGLIDAYFKGREELTGPEWAFMVDASSHFMRMLTGGVFDQFPKLKIILGHLGESIPYNMERIDNRLSAYAKDKLKKSAAEYIKENLYVTTSGNFSIPSLLCAIGTIGIDHVLFSVDYPNEANKVGVNFLNNLPVSQSDLEKIACKNAAKLLNLKDF
ncbi:MAG: amidohydrolase family protein, partial [Candidatus Margulisiibacteriota bacterium]